jgi:transcriptional regulator with XRE-family HTH domain
MVKHRSEPVNFEKLGNLVKQKRSEKGLTVRELHKLCECSIGYISDVENNKMRPSEEMLFRLNNALNLGETAFALAGYTGDDFYRQLLHVIASQVNNSDCVK